MNRFCRPRGLAIWSLLVVLAWAAGCARPAGPQSEERASPSDQHPVPFHDVAEVPARQGESQLVQDNPENSETALPFHDPQNLPAGTLLTVRLKTPISAQNPGTKGIFEAVVDEAVMVEGNRLVPRGTVVAGRVESVRASNIGRNRGYIRLAVDSLHLGGVNLPVQTSSLFVRGTAGDTRSQPGEPAPNDSSPTVIHLEKGRRLTFRLTEPAYIAASQRARVDR